MSEQHIQSERETFLPRILAVSSTLTDEAMAAGRAKASELGFEIDRGLIPLQESFSNLSAARAIVEDALEKNKLTQLPITVQKELLLNFEAVAKSLKGLADGTDEIVNLTSAVENLNTSIWKYGFHNLSDEVLGHQRKLNQLKFQQTKISELVLKAEKAASLIDQAQAAVDTADKARANAGEAASAAQASADRGAALLVDMATTTTHVQTHAASVEQAEKQSSELHANIKTTHSELQAISGSIQRFGAEVDGYRKVISDTSDAASKLLTSTESSAKKLVDDTTSEIQTKLAAASDRMAEAITDLKHNIETGEAASRTGVEELIAKTSAQVEALSQSTAQRVQKASDEAVEKAATFMKSADLNLASLEQRLQERSTETIEANKVRTDALIDELGKLREQIQVQIQQATGFALFGAFQARQNAIVSAKKFWTGAIALLLLLSAGLTAWIAYEAQSYTAGNLAFWVKISLTIPLGFAITFCAVQYGRERRLEEEYAFKATISVSLTGMRRKAINLSP